MSAPVPEETSLTIRGEIITLGQLLKVLGLAHTGGAAKELLGDGGIGVNGEPEDRRGRKLRDGDVVALPDGKRVRIVGGPEP